MNGVVERCEKTVAGRAVIPEGVTRIGEAAFKDCIDLQWVRIPSTVTEIGSSAFKECTALTTFTLPNSLTRIDRQAFTHCSSLASVVIPGQVQEIGEQAFYCCESLTTVVIHPGVTEIGEAVFAPRNRRRKFRGEDVRNYAYNEYIDWEGEYRVEADFDFVTQVIIAQSIPHIHSKSFEDLDNLESIVFPDTYPFCVYDSFDLGIVWEEHFDYETQEYLYKLPDDR